MKLYHGTSKSAARAILEGDDIHPRGIRAGTWHGSSLADCVYLTTAYAPCFALWACMAPNFDMEKLYKAGRLPGRLAILEIDFSQPSEERLFPDENFIGEQQPTEDWRQLYMRTNWRASLDELGTCAHLGLVPREALTRVAFFEHASNPDIFYLVNPRDATAVTVANHTVSGQAHRNLTRLFFKDPDLTADDLMGWSLANCRY